MSDSIAWRPATGTLYGIGTHPNGFDVYRVDDGRGNAGPDDDGDRTGRGPTWSSSPYGQQTPIVVPRPKAQGNMIVASGGYQETVWVRPTHWFAGFGWDDRSFAAGVPAGPTPTPTRWRTAELPFAMAAACFGALPASRLVSAVTRRRRTAAGHCPACGYDLRATPGRCPECGRAAAA